MRYHVTLPSGREIPVDVTHLPDGQVQVSVEGRTLAADAFGDGASTHLRLDGRGVELLLEGATPDVGVAANGRRFTARVESDRARDQRSAASAGPAMGEGLVTSPMPGRVLKVLVREGDEVQAGAPLVVVEAMKMENELSAARSGVVKKIYATPGATVESGARLVEVG
ncbi:biotin/lipoyl-containing protein [Sorangium sp. So ce388]|uniref:biotin/lipoyl-containing protein n=1 Tax=Sorangium sp. So ce388 TaxID=3133309 RepID=UPI003F5C032C